MWPAGTILYEVAPAEVHGAAASVLRAASAKVQRGCLHIRVSADIQVQAAFQSAFAMIAN